MQDTKSTTIKKWRIGASSACLLALSACSSNKAMTLANSDVLPPSLTAPVDIPILRGSSNKDLLLWCMESKKELDNCNEKLASIALCTKSN
jgi:hypothetical protein